MKPLLILVGIAVIWAIWFGVYRARDVITGVSTSARAVKSATDQTKLLQDKLRTQAQQLAASGQKIYDETSQQLSASGKQLLDAKKAQATDYLLQQKELLKQQAKKQVEMEAQKRINAAFSGL